MPQDALQVDQLLIEGIIAISKKSGEDVLSVNKPVDLGSNAIQSSATPTGDNDLMNKASVTSAISTALSSINAKLADMTDIGSVLALQNDPPVSPSEGDKYAVGTGTGDWASHDGDVAEYVSSAWSFTTPSGPVYLFNEDDHNFYYWTGSAWSALNLGMDQTANDARYEQQANLTTDVQSIGDARYLKQDTIGADGTISKQGAVVFNSEAIKTVTFITAFADANYRIFLTPYLNTTCWVDPETKTASGFTIKIGSSTTGSVDYKATHD